MSHCETCQGGRWDIDVLGTGTAQWTECAGCGHDKMARQYLAARELHPPPGEGWIEFALSVLSRSAEACGHEAELARVISLCTHAVAGDCLEAAVRRELSYLSSELLLAQKELAALRAALAVAEAERDALRADRDAVANSASMLARAGMPYFERKAQKTPSHDTGQVLSTAIHAAARMGVPSDGYASTWIDEMRTKQKSLSTALLVADEMAELLLTLSDPEYVPRVRELAKGTVARFQEARKVGK